MTQVEFRKASPRDELLQLMELDRQIFSIYPDDLFEADDWRRYKSYWMIVDGKTIGCSAFDLHVDYDGAPKQGCVYIASTGILPEFQNKGYGRKQKEWQIQYARKHKFRLIVTNMRASNERIISLNESLGFKQRELVSNYYTTPSEDAIVMELYLN